MMHLLSPLFGIRPDSYFWITEGKNWLAVTSAGNDLVLRDVWRAGERHRAGGEQQEITHVGPYASYDQSTS